MSGQSIGPTIPAHLLDGKQPEVEEESSDDDYGPALPPDLASTLGPTTRRVFGPSFPTGRPAAADQDDSDEDVGPMPLPPGQGEEEDGIRNFLEREERRQKAIEVCCDSELPIAQSLISCFKRKILSPKP